MTKIVPLFAAEKCTYRVLWSEEQQRYVGLCSEFPALSCLATTADEAHTGIIECVRRALEDQCRDRRHLCDQQIKERR